MIFGGPRDRDCHRGGEPDSYDPDDFGLTEYYTDEKAANIMKKKRESEISVFYYNVESLPLHFTKLHTKLVMLNIKPDIIVLSETKITWVRNSYYKPDLEGYTFYQSQSSSTHGSVGVFINNSLDIVIRDDLDITVPGIFETVQFDVKHKFRCKIKLFVPSIDIQDLPIFRFSNSA